MTDNEIRDLKFRIELATEEWNNLETYANHEEKSLEEYLYQYVYVGVLTALRQGYIIDAFRSMDEKQQGDIIESLRTMAKSEKHKEKR